MARLVDGAVIRSTDLGLRVQSYLLFAAAFLISVATPGPDVAVVVGKALAGRGLACCHSLIAGILGGKLLLLGAALLGLSALAVALGPWFSAIKLVGAAYLVRLGVRLWRRSEIINFEAPRMEVAVEEDFGLGLAMSLGNPLAVLFYAALLPNVINVDSVTIAMGGILAAIVGFSTLLVYGLYAGLAGRIGELFRSPAGQRRVNRTSGAALVGAAVLVATR